MFIYEVNLHIQEKIYTDYCQWLKHHIRDVLKSPGFLHADVYEIQETENGQHKKITMHYHVDTQKNLDHYLQNLAPALRQDAIDKFGDQFSATRRVLKNKLL